MNEHPIIYILAIISLLAISIGCAYAIAASDLPFWFKFWLLR